MFWVGVHCSDFQEVEGDLDLKAAEKKKGITVVHKIPSLPHLKQRLKDVGWSKKQEQAGKCSCGPPSICMKATVHVCLYIWELLDDTARGHTTKLAEQHARSKHLTDDIIVIIIIFSAVPRHGNLGLFSIHAAVLTSIFITFPNYI